MTDNQKSEKNKNDKSSHIEKTNKDPSNTSDLPSTKQSNISSPTSAQIPSNPSPKSPSTPVAPPPPKSELEIIREQKTAVEKELAEWKDKYMYLQAEMENSRKYYLKQHDVVRNRSKIDIITQFTPLLDSLDFAVKNSNKIKDKCNDPQIATFIKGFENLKQSIMSIFQSLGVTQIDAINKHFDFTIHEAVQTVEKTDIPDETIIQVVQPGYLLNRDVIRPAKVVIAKHPQPPPPPVEVQKEKLPTSTEEKKEKKENPSK